jgi:hypothetical protein
MDMMARAQDVRSKTFLLTVQVPLASTSPPFCRADQVPFAVPPSIVAASTTSRESSGGKS